MFTGIIEAIGEVVKIDINGKNKTFTIKSTLSSKLKVDQSISHNGVCLTVTRCDDLTYDVIAVDETLKKSNLGELDVGNRINLERSMRLGDRLDGHLVQGHVDTVATCTAIDDMDGSRNYSFKYNKSIDSLTVEKGSITINGVSLTVFESKDDSFKVTIIPYTFENTNFKNLRKNDMVNLEFDIVGKYILKLYRIRH